VEVIVVEGPQGGTRFFLMTDDRKAAPVELRFGSEHGLRSGDRIAVDGSYRGNAFHVSALDVEEPDGERPGASVEALVTPDRTDTIAFVMVDYGQGINVDEAEVQDFMFSTTNPGPTLGIGANDRSTLQFYDETSYGHFAVSGDVEGPLDWTGGAACNGSGGSQLANQLRDQITTEYDHYIWYYGTEQSECEYGWGSLGTWNNPSSNVWFNGDLFDGAITHEIGHNLGYQHASSIDCGSVPLANDPMTCETNEYGSAVSIMGNTSNGHMMGIEKWYAGWFQGCNGVRVRSSGTYTLLPIENACDGIQTLQIPMPVTTRTFDTRQSMGVSPARYYYLEYRNGTGLDTGMTPSVIVVASDEIAAPNRNCARSVQLDMNPSSNPLNGMTAGQTFDDPAGGLTIAVTSLTPESAVITVTLAAASMPNTCMDGSTLVGSGPATCSGGSGGTGGAGMGGMAGTGNGAGSGGTTAGTGGVAGGAGVAGLSGAAGTSGIGGASGSGAGGVSAGASGAPAAGASGVTGGAGAATSGAGGMLAGAGGSSSAGVAGIGGATAGGSAGTLAGMSGGVSTSGTTSTAPVAAPNDEGGCGCRLAPSAGERHRSAFGLLGLVVAAFWRRRRVPAV